LNYLIGDLIGKLQYKTDVIAVNLFHTTGASIL